MIGCGPGKLARVSQKKGKISRVDECGPQVVSLFFLASRAGREIALGFGMIENPRGNLIRDAHPTRPAQPNQASAFSRNAHSHVPVTLPKESCKKGEETSFLLLKDWQFLCMILALLGFFLTETRLLRRSPNLDRVSTSHIARGRS